MSESDWVTSTEPLAMLSFLQPRGPLSDRKARLFAVAAVSRLEPLLADDRSRRALRVAEGVADGVADDAERAHAQELADAARAEAEARYEAAVNESTYAEGDEVIAAGWRLLIPVDAAAAAHAALHPSATTAATDVVQLMLSTEEWGRQAARWEAGVGRSPDDDAPGLGGHPRLAALLRDIAGNSPNSTTFTGAWRTEPVLALARGIYDDRAWERLPVLAAALEDAGCANEDILGHCRGPGPHVRGCFVLDAVLGKA